MNKDSRASSWSHVWSFMTLHRASAYSAPPCSFLVSYSCYHLWERDKLDTHSPPIMPCAGYQFYMALGVVLQGLPLPKSWRWQFWWRRFQMLASSCRSAISSSEQITDCSLETGGSWMPLYKMFQISWVPSLIRQYLRTCVFRNFEAPVVGKNANFRLRWTYMMNINNWLSGFWWSASVVIYSVEWSTLFAKCAMWSRKF